MFAPQPESTVLTELLVAALPVRHRNGVIEPVILLQSEELKPYPFFVSLPFSPVEGVKLDPISPRPAYGTLECETYM